MYTIEKSRMQLLLKSQQEKSGWNKESESFQMIMCVANTFTWHFCNPKKFKCNLVLVPRHNRQLIQNYFHFVNTLFLKHKKDQRKRRGPFSRSVNQITTRENGNVTLRKRRDTAEAIYFHLWLEPFQTEIFLAFSHIQLTANICSPSVQASFLTKLISNMSYFHRKKGPTKWYKEGLLQNKKKQAQY